MDGQVARRGQVAGAEVRGLLVQAAGALGHAVDGGGARTSLVVHGPHRAVVAAALAGAASGSTGVAGPAGPWTAPYQVGVLQVPGGPAWPVEVTGWAPEDDLVQAWVRDGAGGVYAVAGRHVLWGHGAGVVQDVYDAVRRAGAPPAQAAALALGAVGGDCGPGPRR